MTSTYIASLFVIFGLCFGSFANVLIYRLPRKISLVERSSHCPNCQAKIKWYDNIPLFSYIILGGKCRNCHSKISFRYLLVEVLTAALWLFTYLYLGLTALAIITCFILLAFIVLTFIDIEYYEIPNRLNIFLALLGVVALFIAPIEGRVLVISYKSRLLSLVSSMILIALFYIFGKLAKKELIGGGDLKLLAAIGIFLGWELQILGLIIASLIGVFVEIPARLITKKSLQAKLPFGPYLALGFTVSLFFGLKFIEWYLSFFQLI